MGQFGMSRAESRIMYTKVKRAREAHAERAKTEAETRHACPLERAKTFLRSRGWHVFAEHVLGGQKQSSGMIVVGRTVMAPEAVIAMAARLRT